MSGRRWALLGSPLDCSGRGRGEERGPDALRAAGLVDRLGIADRGDMHPLLTDARRDPATGIVGFAQVRDACEGVRDRVRGELADGLRPLVVGGDCSFLVGALAGARLSMGRVGLAFFDGHLDSLDGSTSPTGECADMDLAISYGHGPPGIVDLAGPPPTVSPRDVIAVGYRPSDGLEERVVDKRTVRIAADELRRRDATAVGADIAQRADKIGRYWVHLDVDVLDEKVLTAVTYPQGGGIDYETLALLLRPALSGAGLIGFSVADLVPPLDVDGTDTRRLTAFLVEMLSP
ncbi:arginase family protein [Nocardia sp. NPDC055029]